MSDAPPKLLTDETVLADPFDQFTDWFDAAKACQEITQPEAMSLATLTPDGYPDTRMLLMKDYSRAGFTFFTNINSVKGKSLKKTPRATLMFYWEKQSRAVRIMGDVSLQDKKIADDYFATRARMSQISSWVSDQSMPVKDRETMVRAVEEYRKKFHGQDVPPPPHWYGYSLQPIRFEFWQLRPDRLHDRFVFIKQGKTWSRFRLYP